MPPAPDDDRPWRWYVALDGGELDGLIGEAGVMRFDWPSKRIVHRFYDGVSAAHNVTLCPDGKKLLLGNFSQQIVIVDAETLDEISPRKSTMGIEECDYKLRSNTHHLWYNHHEFIAPIGEHLYRFDVNDLSAPVRLGPHRLLNVHEIRWSHKKTHLLMGDLGPESSGARQVGVYDLATNTSTVIKLPGTVWHVCVHPDRNVGYAATYSIAADTNDYIEWAPAFTREYLFEIDLDTATILRSWSSSADFPVHLNSDLEIWHGEEPKLYIASGGSHTVVEIDLTDFATPRHVEVMPGWFGRHFLNGRQFWRNVWGVLLRKSFYTNTHLLLQTFLVTGWRWADGVYCVRASPDGKYLVAGSRGYNYLRVMDRKSFATVYETRLPRLPKGQHLGMHHSELIAVKP